MVMARFRRKSLRAYLRRPRPPLHPPKFNRHLPPLSREIPESHRLPSRAGYRLYFLSVLWSPRGPPVVFFRSGLIAKLRSFAESRTSSRSLQAVLSCPPLFAHPRPAHSSHSRLLAPSLPLLPASIEPWGPPGSGTGPKPNSLEIALALLVVALLFALIRSKPLKLVALRLARRNPALSFPRAHRSVVRRPALNKI